MPLLLMTARRLIALLFRDLHGVTPRHFAQSAFEEIGLNVSGLNVSGWSGFRRSGWSG